MAARDVGEFNLDRKKVVVFSRFLDYIELISFASFSILYEDLVVFAQTV